MSSFDELYIIEAIMVVLALAITLLFAGAIFATLSLEVTQHQDVNVYEIVDMIESPLNGCEIVINTSSSDKKFQISEAMFSNLSIGDKVLMNTDSGYALWMELNIPTSVRGGVV